MTVELTDAGAATPTASATSRPGAARQPGQEVPGFPRRDRCLVMGIVNVTPDSFSDGGAYLAAASAVEHGLALARSGADIIDIGGESTRPGAARVEEAEELRRVLPVVRELSAAGLTVTIDTTRSRVATAALAAGAAGVNDVSGGLADPDMSWLIAEAHVPYIATHWRGPSRDMQQRAAYTDVVAEVAGQLRSRLDALLRAGVDRRQVVLDPGLGFAKQPAHNWQLLNRFAELKALGQPVLVGASRKAFLGALLRSGEDTPPPAARDMATAAVSALAAVAGAYCVRVHDVPASLDAVRVAAEWTAPHDGPSRLKEGQ
jgi:dihydropteroate synthase